MPDLKLNLSSKLICAVAINGLILLSSSVQAQTKGSGQKSSSGSTHSHSAKSNTHNSQPTDGQRSKGAGSATASGTGDQNGQGGKKNEISTLRKAKKLLEEAKHDYKGHRARAMHAIHEAIQELEQHGQNQHARNSQAGSATAGRSASGHSSGDAHHAASGAGSTNHNNGTLHRQATSTKQSPGAQLTQADSDSHLRSAQQLLMQAQTQMSGKHAGAANHIQVALTEVQQALQVKHEIAHK
jgi:hypothetical protein